MKTLGRKIAFVGNCISESTANVCMIDLNFTLTPIIEIKTFDKELPQGHFGLEIPKKNQNMANFRLLD